MKRLFAFFVTLLLLFTSAYAETATVSPEVPVFGELTGYTEFLALITEDNPVISATFTEGYGFSGGEYTTEDPQELQALLDAMGLMEIDSVSNMDLTDWYPQIYFVCADGTAWGVHFVGHWLCTGKTNYNLANDSTFWALFTQL